MEQRPGISAADRKPGRERGPTAGGEVGEAGPAALAAADGDGATLRVDVGQVQGDGLRAAQSTAVEEGEGAGVPGTSRPGGVGGTGGEERSQLTGVQSPTAGQGGTADRRQVNRPAIVVAVHEPRRQHSRRMPRRAQRSRLAVAGEARSVSQARIAEV